MPQAETGLEQTGARPVFADVLSASPELPYD
jgi:hypothetical protein